MKLLGIDFGRVQNASGARGFFGEGYPFHKHLRPFGLNFDGSTFVAKTATLFQRQGHLAYETDGVTLSETSPRCVKVYWRRGMVLNAVGLGNPGFERLLDSGRWQERREPFFLSFAAVMGLNVWRLFEAVQFARMLAERRAEFRAPFGLQINFSCPNSPCRVEDLVSEALEIIGAVGYILPDVPLVPKFSIATSPSAVARIAEHPRCDAVCVSNAVRWNDLPQRIPWDDLFGTRKSPLDSYGGGGLSGAPLLEPVCDWIGVARRFGLEKPIVAGGGVLCARDGADLFAAGADAVALGSIAILRPWRVRRVIRILKK